MKRFIAFALALAAVWSASAIPDDVALGCEDFPYELPASAVVLDEGEGDVATVYVARKTDFEPFRAALLRPCVSSPRVVAVLFGDGFDPDSGDVGLAALVNAVLSCKGIASACIVTCGDCALAAARARAYAGLGRSRGGYAETGIRRGRRAGLALLGDHSGQGSDSLAGSAAVSRGQAGPGHALTRGRASPPDVARRRRARRGPRPHSPTSMTTFIPPDLSMRTAPPICCTSMPTSRSPNPVECSKSTPSGSPGPSSP